MSNTSGRLFRLANMLGRSSHYSANRRSFAVRAEHLNYFTSAESRRCWS